MAEHNIDNAPIEHLLFNDLRLRPGMPVQAQRALKGAPKLDVQFLAAIRDKSVMVGPLGSDKWTSEIQNDEDYVVFGFTGQYDFVFTARVIQTFEDPFTYALLAYPAAVKVRKVRSDMRIKISISGNATGSGGTGPIAVTLVDASTSGALIKAPAAIGAVGDQVALDFSVAFASNKLQVSSLATIRHINNSDNGDGVNMGLQFQSLTQTDKLALHYLVQSVAE